ncbi:unnamed protein product [Polarella glacialis]|uniref:Uncharacterized protein n=1 Tax=Polarella glacialis TaxID=89957 RepID=A0A813H0U8_POLGL|nr:unnamed protein product [Polarella glacialis]
MALSRKAPTLLVDADDPAHGMGDALGIGDLPIDRPKALQLLQGEDLSAAQLSGPSTRIFLEHLLAADKWRRLLEDDAGAKLVAALGVPMGGLLQVLDCVQPPPGAEMPVALARLLAQTTEARLPHVVVDGGAAVLAVQLQSVPPAVADGLGGFLRLQELIKVARESAMPSAVISGIRLFVGRSSRQEWSSQYQTTITGLEQLREAMSGLAQADKAVLLVLPYRPGRAGERAACRTIERLQPSCIALTGHKEPGATFAERPTWLPPGPAVVMLPWGDERPSGLEELQTLADAMLCQ